MVLQMTRMGPTEIAKDFGPNYFRDAANRGLSVSQLLENLDPSTAYAADSDDRQLDAFERLTRAMNYIPNPLDRAGIRASTYEEVEKTPEGKAWFSEFCARIWRETAHFTPPRQTTRTLLESGDYALNGALRPYTDNLALHVTPRLQIAIPLDTIIAGTRMIDGDAYRSIYITDSLTTDAYRMKRVGEGADIPATSMVTGEHYLRIHKFGRAIRYTYEQMRRQRLDRIAYLVARIALIAEADKVGLALNTIVSGDGNANTAATVTALTALDAAAVAGTLTLKGWLSFKNQYYPYIPTVVLAQEAAVLQLELLPISTGNSLPMLMAPGSAFGGITPINPTAWNLRYGIVASAPALKLVTFDPNWAVEQVAEIGAQISELEKFINNQTWMLTMTESVGYGVIDPAAARILNINA
jgi:hypothetical protein